MRFAKVNDSCVRKEDDSVGTFAGPSGTASPSDGDGPSNVSWYMKRHFQELDQNSITIQEHQEHKNQAKTA